jgi:hypothetical protein
MVLAPKSPNLILFDFFLWNLKNNMAYKTRSQKGLGLLHRIMNAATYVQEQRALIFFLNIAKRLLRILLQLP